MGSDPMILKYSYADFGSVSVPLYQESKDIIEFFQEAEKDGLRHYERLDHLGRIRDAHKSAHHSRWEYMFLQMYLFDKFKEVGSSFGFSGGIKLDRRYRISSSSELLKSWTLLLNFGHFQGTFECERAWFEILKEEKDIFAAFLGHIPDKDLRRKAKRIFDDENYYKLHEIVSLIILSHYGGLRKYSAFSIEKFISILRRYILETPGAFALNRCKSIFRRVRKIAYVLLDCSYSSSFMKINPKIFFDYILKNSKKRGQVSTIDKK